MKIVLAFIAGGIAGLIVGSRVVLWLIFWQEPDQ